MVKPISHARDSWDADIESDLINDFNDGLDPFEHAVHMTTAYHRLLRRVEDVIEWANENLNPEDHEAIEWIRLKAEAGFRG